MKKLLPVLPFFLLSCSTTQQAQIKADAVASAPIVEAGITAAGGQYGPLAAALWGGMVQAYAGQPVANGTSNAALGNAITVALPAGAKTGPVAAALLTAAANQAQAKTP